MSQFHGFAIDGFDFTGTDERGCRWTVEKIEGWYTGGQVRSSPEARMQQNGDWRGQAYRGGRVITLRGKVFAPNTTELELSARRLSQVVGTGGFTQFVGDSPAGTLTSWVQLDETPLFDTQASHYATWQVTVGSEDPLLYGLATFAESGLSSATPGTGLVFPLVFPLDFGAGTGPPPGAIVAANVGSASYLPRIRIDGPVTNPVVTLAETGDRIAYAGALLAGQWLDIDCAARRVLINGQTSMRHRVTFVGAWLAIPVGGGTFVWTADDSDPAAKLSVWAFEGAWL